MNQESVVYGCIKHLPVSGDADKCTAHRENNRQVMMSLPSIEQWPLLSREMFSMAQPTVIGDSGEQTDVMHFGTSYRAVEYEWQQWLDTFEDILKRMYWVSAVVHLETAFNGRHTFTWEPENGTHEPGSAELSVRCEWSRESSSF